jgi:tRNA U34 5-methylaminomethyl-2-thiouridine-forming methyltransferase MnmC
MREVKVIRTEDGSSSLYLPELNETYHSHHGALGESQHVFIRMGLEYWLSTQGEAEEQEVSSLNIFEVGFGTGLNALLAYEAAEKRELRIHYTTLEPYPLAEETVSTLNYAGLLDGGAYADAFKEMHAVSWEAPEAISEHFTILKHRVKLEDFIAPSSVYDLIFFDAFAPSKQAELWEKALLEKVVKAMAPGAVFTTYCAKGQLKRDLKALGLQVETLPGAPGKKEMVRAVK